MAPGFGWVVSKATLGLNPQHDTTTAAAWIIRDVTPLTTRPGLRIFVWILLIVVLLRHLP